MSDLEFPDVSEAMEYAKRVAFRMDSDRIEMESLAGRISFRAQKTYNPSFGVPWKRWVARLTKHAVICVWRKRRSLREKQDHEWLEENATFDHPALEEDLIPFWQYSILHEHYIERWCIDVQAKRHGVSVYRMKQLLEEAANTLKEAMEA